jgi:hypothetical protein
MLHFRSDFIRVVSSPPVLLIETSALEIVMYTSSSVSFLQELRHSIGRIIRKRNPKPGIPGLG